MLRIYITPPPPITSEDGDISSPPSDGTTPGAPPPRAAAPPGQFFQELMDPRLFGQFAPQPMSAPPGQFLQRLMDPKLFGQAVPQPAPPGRFLESIGVKLPPAVPPVLMTRRASPAVSEPPTLAVRPVPAQDVVLDNALLEPAPATGPTLPGQEIAGFGTTAPRVPAEFERTQGDGVWRNAAAGIGEHVYGRIGQVADPAAEVINGGIDGLNTLAGTDIERLPVPSRWLAENAESHLGVPDPAHTLAITPGEKAARLGGKTAALLADLRLTRGRGLPGYVLPGPGLPVPSDRPGLPAPTDPGQPERWDASYEDMRDLAKLALDLLGELHDAIYPPAPPPLKSLDQATDGLIGGVPGPGDDASPWMVQGSTIRDYAEPLIGGLTNPPARPGMVPAGGAPPVRRPDAYENRMAPPERPPAARAVPEAPPGWSNAEILAPPDPAAGRLERPAPHPDGPPPESGNGRKATGDYYTVAFEMRLAPTSYPGRSRRMHNREANEALLHAMEQDPQFAQMINELGITLQRTPTGLAPDSAPQGWTWHHADEPGLMQLVERSQHESREFRKIFHPDKGRGGFYRWGVK